ncbi:hypothetical protein QQX10_10575 [Demequina sp. SYSU T00039]|uniref:Replication region DNA-binding N-term n=1 Tax=Demequina lignilytica TaxID=3051663 RepID=A0AAW7M796_9MICO|nr:MULTISPECIES: hypothetical protein [unclassified Demequina]MDN4478633.1 hypothetical protein [Demequina sp. SYSU T00039-1]MDN4488611.1 hypothetical protein [Demequina sp. SYSU T00039]
MDQDFSAGASASAVELYIAEHVAEHGVLPTIAQVREGGVRARTATIAAALRQARATAARTKASNSTSPEAVEAIVELGRAMASAATRVLDDEVASLVERVLAPARAVSDEVIAAAFGQRDAALAELAAEVELRAVERDVLENQLSSLRDDIAAIRSERDAALHARDLAFEQRDRALGEARAAQEVAELARSELTAAAESTQAAARQSEIALAEERGRRLAAEDRITALEGEH